MRYRLPFRRDNRRPDGTWAAEDATEDNIKGTSVDRYEPVWPSWKKTPPSDFEGEFVSDEPFFDIDEITQTARFYPPGTPLVDKNLDGNPASRQRVRDGLTGNLWRRRLLVDRGAEPAAQGDGPDGGSVRVAQNPLAGPQGVRGIPPPPNPPFVPDWLPPAPITVPFPSPFKDGETRYESAPGFIYDQNYWQIDPSRPNDRPKRYLPFEPNRNPDRNNNRVPDNVEPGNPTGSYLFPALISALRRRRPLG